MAVIDVIIVLASVASAVMGWRKGLIAQFGSVAAIVTAIVACRLLGATAASLIMPEGAGVMQHYACTVAAYSVIYLAVYYGVVLVAKMMRTIATTLLLGPLDRMAGALASMAKWLMALSILLNLYISISPQTPLLKASQLMEGRPAAWITDLAPAVWGVVKQGLFQYNMTPSSGTVHGTEE